jgi:putative transposase
MILGLVYTVVRSLLDLLAFCRKTEATLQIEVLALRHPLRVLERQVKRPRFQAADRLLLSALSRILPRPAWHFFLVSPETLLRWHRELVRRKWALYARRPLPGRRGQSPERQELIVRLARENPRWGYRRIQGELLKLGCHCSHGTVRNVLRRHGLLPPHAAASAPGASSSASTPTRCWRSTSSPWRRSGSSAFTSSSSLRHEVAHLAVSIV